MPYYPNITIPNTGGGSGLAFSTTCIIDFANVSGGEQEASSVITVAASWVTTSMELYGYAINTLAGGHFGPSAEHDPEDIIVEGILVNVSNVVPGVGFDVQGFAVNNTWGQYLVNITGQ